MKDPSTARRQRFGIIGIGAAACLACCSGPLLAVLGGISLVGLASTVFIGGAGIVVATLAGAGIVLVRRRRRASGDTDTAERVPVSAPRPKVPSP